MCGIAGIISSVPGKYTIQDVETMSSCISHRGPDGAASWQNQSGKALLAHRRLAIIDLSPAAAQPMHYRDRYTIVHNGEVYNYVELRDELRSKGYAFQSESDTEVILAAYDCWKEECLQRFDGMFAFAIWDEKDQALFAARDRFGEKPFYFTTDANAESFFFASETKAIHRLRPETKAHNGNQLLQYLGTGVSWTSNPYETFYSAIHKLPPRHWLRYTPAEQKLDVVAYYDLDKQHRIVPGIEAAATEFRKLFLASVQRRLRSDVEIGTSLSGGIDSSSVVAAIAQLKEKDSVQKAFTASFPDFEKDETAKAAMVARQFGLQHHLVQPQVSGLAEDLQQFLAQHDEPISSSSVYAQYKVCQLAKQHGVKVLLDGQGADEVLAGYSRYIHWYLQELYSTDKKLFSQEAASLNFHFGTKHKLAAMFPGWAAIRLESKALKAQKHADFNRDFVQTHFSKHQVYKPPVKSLNDILYFDLFSGPLDELLRNADRNAMAQGIEVRLPFLAAELVEYVFSLPSDYKIHGGHSKYLLRRSVDAWLPHEITWNRDKIGFEPPQQQWMQDQKLQDLVHEAKKRLVDRQILRPQVLKQAVQARAAHEKDNLDWRYLSAAALL